MRPQGNYREDPISARGLCVQLAKVCAGWVWLGDDAYRAATHLKTGFGRVRLGGLDIRVTLSSSFASSLSCASC